MIRERRSPISFNDNFQVAVQIRIHKTQHGYDADLQAGLDRPHRVSIRLGHHDVESLNQELQAGIERVTNSFGDGESTTSAQDRMPYFIELARLGKYAFNTIFADGAPRQAITEALKTGSTIQFSSEEFFIPWELIYDQPVDGQKLDPFGFWGLRYVISRSIIRDYRPGDFLQPILETPRPNIGLVSCGDLTHVFAREIPTLETFRNQNQINLISLRSLDVNRHESEIKEFSRFLCQEIHVAHFACHAYQMDPLSQSYMLVDKEFAVSIRDMVLEDFHLLHNPFVILNACRSGTMNPLYASNWAAQFWDRGARGVLATEFRVPDWFAAAFIAQVYKHLLARETIGSSLLATRRHFWSSETNPLGLAYALYSSPSIQITT